MATLYEINQRIIDCFDAETGEIKNSEEFYATQMELNDKIENIALYIKNLRADAEAYKTEKKAFEEREKAARNKADRISEYLDSMLCGNPFKTAKCAISYRKSDAVVIDDMLSIPADFLKFSEPTADKAGIKEAIKSGAVIAGAHIETRNNMNIR